MTRIARSLTALLFATLVAAGASAQTMAPASSDRFQVAVAQYYLDSAGFHGLAESLATNKKIDPATVSPLTRVKKVLDQAPWPTPLKPQAQEFLGNLASLVDALKNGKVDDAIKFSDLVHEEQHALSSAIDRWIGQK